MRSKKLSCILLTGALALSGVAGCSKKTDDTQTTAEVTQVVATTAASMEETTKADATVSSEENNAVGTEENTLSTETEETTEVTKEPETEAETEKETETVPEKDVELSEDAAKVLRILTGIYEMKGMDYESHMSINGVNIALFAKIDYKNNYSFTLQVNQPILEELPIKGDLMTVSMIGNDLYVDLRKAFEQVEEIVGKDAIAQVDQMVSQEAGISIRDLLVIKISLGNIDRDGFTLKSIKPLYEIVLRAAVKALDEAGVLKNGDDMWYEITLEKNEKFSKFVSLAINGILSEKERLFDEAFTLIELMKLPENADTVVKEFMGQVKENLKKNLSEEDYNAMLKDLAELEALDIKKELAGMIDSLKEEKEDMLENVPAEIPQEVVEAMYNEYDGTLKMTLAPQDEGYLLDYSFAMYGDNIKGAAFVREYDQLIAAPQGAKEVDTISVMMAITAPQYIRYIEKSREAKDHLVEKEIDAAIRIICREDKVLNALDEETYVYYDGTSFTTSLKDEEALIKELEELLGYDQKGWNSKTYRGITLKYKVAVNKENAAITVECENSPYQR